MNGFTLDYELIKDFLLRSFDIGLVFILIFILLSFIGEHRNRWMLRGLIFLTIATIISNQIELTFLSFVLEKLVFGSAVAIAAMFQSEFRRFLELLGKGEFVQLFKKQTSIANSDSAIDQIVDAVKELSQNRTGALIVIETFDTLDERIFVNPGVTLNAEVSKELLQTIFQTKTLLHDGAVFIRNSQLVSASVILPLSERSASRQLGTRHRAAMGITERIENCLCVVVSEETGSISLGEKGILNRPLTSSKLKELLEEKLSPSVEREKVRDLSLISRKIGFEGIALLKRLIRLVSLKSQRKK